MTAAGFVRSGGRAAPLAAIALLAACSATVSRLGQPTGCPSGCAAGDRRPGPLRVLALNAGQAGPCAAARAARLELIAGEIVRSDPDLVVLVELAWTPGLGDGAGYVARRTGRNHVSVRSAGNRWVILLEERIAILSRFPLRDPAVFVLEQPNWFERRIVLRATAATPWGEVLVFATHLEPWDRVANARQMRGLEALVERHAGLALVAGDLNAIEYSPQMRALAARWLDTWRIANPDASGITCCVADVRRRDEMRIEGRLDYVLVRPAVDRPVAVVSSRLVLTEPVRRGDGWLWATDHFGVLTELALAPPGSASRGHGRLRGRRPAV